MNRYIVLTIFSLIMIAFVALAPLSVWWQNVILGLAVNLLSAVIIIATSIVLPTRLIWYGLMHPNSQLRVSFAALIRLEVRGKFILIELERRPSTLGPIGGVYKYFDSARSFLDSIEFKRDYSGLENAADMERDIRGFLPMSNAQRLIRWFESSVDRESDAISRELKEELVDRGILPSSTSLLSMQKRLVRSVYEGPYRVKGKPYYQFRRFDVFEPTMLSETQEVELNALIDFPPSPLKIVSLSEIESNLTKDGCSIGDHCDFLISSQHFAGKLR